MDWIKYMKISKAVFRGVISRDQILSIVNAKRGYYIVNLNDSTQPGSHWVVIHVRSKSTGQLLEYFDSFGLNAPNEVVELSDRLGVYYIYNSTQYQDLNSVLCGYWCLYFVNESRKGKSFYEIVRPFSQTDTQFNERLIVEYFRKI